MALKVLYFGPISPAGSPSIGGFEAANRKNIDKLRELGVEVEEFANPIINKKYGKLAKLAYLKLFFSPLGLLKYAFRKDVIVHTTPLYGRLILPSLWLLNIAKLAGIKRVVDIRAGSLIYCYNRKKKSGKKHIEKLLKLADKVTVEGSYYIDAIRDIIGLNLDISYFPNLAVCNNLKYTERSTDRFNIFYFGRITEAKGIDTLLDMMSLLNDSYHLYLAGGIDSSINKDDLRRDNITYLGKLKPEELKKEMQRMHYFVFPTRHIGEGQSNSLIEAMSNGLVPLVTNQGFCGEVVKDCGIIMSKDKTGKDYAEVIKSMDKEKWTKLSRKAYNHIKECHNVDVEIPNLVNIYKYILNGK